MPVYLPTAVVGNDETLVTLGDAGEIMGWFYPFKDHSQNIHECMPCIYRGGSHHGVLSWLWGDDWQRRQSYQGDSNIIETVLSSESMGLEITFLDFMLTDSPVLVRRMRVRNHSDSAEYGQLFHYADWNLGGIRTGNGLIFEPISRTLRQRSHDVSAIVGGDALESWHCGKAGRNWGSNALYGVEQGSLSCSELEIGDVNWAFGFRYNLNPGESVTRTVYFALGVSEVAALRVWDAAVGKPFEDHEQARRQHDARYLEKGLKAMDAAGGQAALPPDIAAAYRRSLLCLPLLCGEEGVPLAAPEFDPEFISCGGYGYFWPRDGAEYASGLLDAGYPEFSERLFQWCARHQHPAGLWMQRYFLNGQPGPNWCLPPDRLQVDQVGAVLWMVGKYLDQAENESALAADDPALKRMVAAAADYLLSRLSDSGVLLPAFDTWESFVGSFTYSNAATYAGLQAASRVLKDSKYSQGAERIKTGVLKQFTRKDYLARGLNQEGHPDDTVDSSSLGAIEPFGLLNLEDSGDLAIALGTLKAVRDCLEVDWEGGRAVRRFEGDEYVGGVPACVNTLWMARCCLKVADRLDAIGNRKDAARLTADARGYLSTVLRRATVTGLLPELMQGPTGQRYWAAPHGWAMASFVSGALMLARRLAAK